jgi:deoxyribodipyrimidine photolyase-related protein
MHFLILPDQLFEKAYFDKTYEYVLWECPHYFKKYNYNKKKLVLHRASMMYFYDYMQQNGYKIKYCEFTENIHKYNDDFILYQPLNKVEILNLPKYTIYQHNTPALLLAQEDYVEYNKKTKKFFFNAFYMWSKKKTNIIPSIKSLDKENRQRISSTNIKIKQPNTQENKYILEASNYVNKYFPNNYGSTDDFMYPVTHKDAQNWLTHFLKHKFKNFGPYQDFIHKDDPFLYHSLLSALINIGLITPSQVIKHIRTYHSKNKVPLNSYEGFIRQLFWREYQYYCYMYYDFDNLNYFENNKKITKDWYTANLGIEPVDDAIKDGFASGYLHHIRRLMVVGNFMNLSGIHPKEGFRWFMEFSCDSYEWVMHQNVLDMVFFVSGGATMRRPYISSSNYILKMSNYKKGEWSIHWDTLYKQFVNKNKKKLWKFRYYVRF